MHRKLVPAERIILLAFNSDAAKELQHRIGERLSAVGLDGTRVAVRTFHAFGLEIIGLATGKRPSLAPWLEGKQDLEQLGRIVDELRKDDVSFRAQWDFFRFVLGRDLTAEGAGPTGRGATSQLSPNLRTLRGETVKSQGERMIADWLFYNARLLPLQIGVNDREIRQIWILFRMQQLSALREHAESARSS